MVLAGWAPSATVAAAKARQVKAPRGDGHALRAEDAANSSGGGGSHNCVLREGAEDGSGQGHHHGRGLDDDGGGLALITAGNVSGMEVHLGEGTERKQNMGMHEKQLMRESMHMQCRELKTVQGCARDSWSHPDRAQ